MTALIALLVGFPGQLANIQRASPRRKDKVVLTPAQWRRRLSPDAYSILRERGTETRGSSPLLKVREPGVFSCAGCGLALYRTADKFDSGTGWPSFVRPITRDAVWYRSRRPTTVLDRSEVVCARCDGHLGHVFEDGPKRRGGLRYCIDGDALVFKKEEK